MAHDCNLCTLEGQGRRLLEPGIWDQPGQHSKTPSVQKNKKNISHVWWCMPLVSTTWKGEAGELLETRRSRLKWALIVPLHSILGNRVRPCRNINIKWNNCFIWDFLYYNIWHVNFKIIIDYFLPLFQSKSIIYSVGKFYQLKCTDIKEWEDINS